LTGVPMSGTGSAQRFALGAGALISARAIQFALSMVVTIALVRYLGPGDYGDYIFVVSLTGALVVLCDFGLLKVAVGEITREPEAQDSIIGTVILARLVIAALVAGGAQLFLAGISARETVRIAVLIASAWFVSEALLSIVVLFQVRLAMQFEALASLISNLVQAGGAMWLLLNHGTIHQIVALPAIGGFVAASVAGLVARKRYGAGVRVDVRRLKRLLAVAVPVGLTTAIGFLGLKLGGVLLGVMASPEDVGLYGAASRLLEYVVIAAAIVLNPAYPLLVRWHLTDPERGRQLYERVVTGVLIAALPIPLALAFFADRLVAVLYPPEFAASAVVFQVLGVALFLLVLNVWHAFVLLAAQRQRLILAYDAAALAANVGLNLLLIPQLGYLGAAWAALGASSVTAVCAIAAATRVGARFDHAPLARIALAGIAFAAAVWIGRAGGVSDLASLLVASLAYGGVVLATRAVDWRAVRALAPMKHEVSLPAPQLELP
jgi:O-antigen/teichoic acid export membrane protein